MWGVFTGHVCATQGRAETTKPNNAKVIALKAPTGDVLIFLSLQTLGKDCQRNCRRQARRPIVDLSSPESKPVQPSEPDSYSTFSGAVNKTFSVIGVCICYEAINAVHAQDDSRWNFNIGGGIGFLHGDLSSFVNHGGNLLSESATTSTDT
jgi:hypothetical protein